MQPRTISCDIWRAVTACCFLALCSTLVADDKKPNADELVKQLDSDEFADRQAATEKLTALGTSAIPALIQGAQSRSLEPRRRSLAVLSGFFKGQDAETKAAAKKALEELASGKDVKLSSAAKKILEPPRAPQVNGVFGGGIQLNIRGGANVQVSVTDANGVKTITVKENDVTAKIVQDPNGIHGELTKKDANGKEQTTKVEAKDADDLKKKSPELHGYFEKYGQARGGIVGARIQLGQRAPRAINPAQMLIPGLVDPQDLKGADDNLAKAIEQLKELAKATDKPDSINEAIKSLEAARGSIEKMKQGSDMREFHKRFREAIELRQQDLRRQIPVP
ncbi:MAG: hypothetical protein O3A00_14085 [Planctomycetota bacterium]|nr:hypothetical protein [Planctomycetota bacterium]